MNVMFRRNRQCMTERYKIKKLIIEIELSIIFNCKMGSNPDKIFLEQSQPSKTGDFITPQDLEEIARSSIDLDSMKRSTSETDKNNGKYFQKDSRQSESFYQEETGQKITEKNKRVLRIIKNIIGEKNMNFRSEQILIDLIENKGIKDQQTKAQYKKLYEEYLKLQKPKQEDKNEYFFKIAEKTFYQKPIDPQPAQYTQR